jgi:hypothetical protein
MSESDPIPLVETAPLGLIQDHWPAVLEELIRCKAVTTSALASCATPARVEGGVLILQFRIPTLLTLFRRGRHRAVLAAAVETIVGNRYQISLEAVPPAGERLRCAKCGTTRVVLVGSEKDRNVGGTWVTGRVARNYFTCVNGHAFKVEFGVHAEQTFTRIVVGPDLTG